MAVRYSEYSLHLVAPNGDVEVISCDTILQGLAVMQDIGLAPPISSEWWIGLFRHEADISAETKTFSSLGTRGSL